MTTVLQVKERKEFQGSALTRIRREGNIPAVVYGEKLESKPIYFSEKDFTQLIRKVGRNGVIALELDGIKHNVVLSEYQADPLKNVIIHADFLAVDMSQDIIADVRVILEGDAEGVKDGGVIQQSIHEVSVTAKQNLIPQSITVDVTGFQVNETITIADLRTNRDFVINHEDDEVIASILPPKQVGDSEEEQDDTPQKEVGTKASED